MTKNQIQQAIDYNNRMYKMYAKLDSRGYSGHPMIFGMLYGQFARIHRAGREIQKKRLRAMSK